VKAFEAAEMRRQLASLVSFGVVTATLDFGARARVRIEGGLETPPLSTLKRRGRGDRENWPLEVGEQVLCLFPSGSLAQGVILGSVMTNDSLPKEDGHRLSYSDGTSVSYDKAAKAMRVVLPEGARLEVEGGASIVVKAKAVVVEAETVALGGADASAGVVTTEAVCAFTGGPHPQGSTRCKAKHA
jgi:phage baseplate assembly protein V